MDWKELTQTKTSLKHVYIGSIHTNIKNIPGGVLPMFSNCCRRFMSEKQMPQIMEINKLNLWLSKVT